MKFPSIRSNAKTFLAYFAVALVAVITFSTVPVTAQGTDGNPSSDIDQCQNGSLPAARVPCSWVNGNLNVNNSQWKEGQSVPYRIKFSGLDPNTPYTITLGYDTTEGGTHTLDYLTTITRTMNLAGEVDPCIGVGTGCSAGTYNSFDIPLDPRVQAGPDGTIGNADDIQPGPDGTAGTLDDDVNSTGKFRMYGGGSITQVSAYSYNGVHSGNSQAFITLTFNSGLTPDVLVLGWSGHISSRFDWGFANSAVTLTGSSYHMRTAGGTSGSGNQDRSMKVDAVVFPGFVTIRKQVNFTFAGTPQTTSTRAFGFSSTNFTPVSAFSLTDDRPGDAPSVPGTFSDTISVTYETFGQTITVTEDSLTGTNWSLAGLTCSINGGGNTAVGSVLVPPAPGSTARTATIVLQEANIASCVFVNSTLAPSAAPADVSGRVATSGGRGISGAMVSIFNTSTGQFFTRTTNTFGYYQFNDLPVSDFYVMTVSHKRYLFLEASRSFTLEEDMFDVDFTASEGF